MERRVGTEGEREKEIWGWTINHARCRMDIIKFQSESSSAEMKKTVLSSCSTCNRRLLTHADANTEIGHKSNNLSSTAPDNNS